MFIRNYKAQESKSSNAIEIINQLPIQIKKFMPKTINSRTILKKYGSSFSNFDKMVKSILAWRKLS
ncbi:hypothetical protein LguiB_006003 [Lonicera macranthoides]